MREREKIVKALAATSIVVAAVWGGSVARSEKVALSDGPNNASTLIDPNLLKTRTPRGESCPPGYYPSNVGCNAIQINLINPEE